MFVAAPGLCAVPRRLYPLLTLVKASSAGVTTNLQSSSDNRQLKEAKDKSSEMRSFGLQNDFFSLLRYLLRWFQGIKDPLQELSRTNPRAKLATYVGYEATPRLLDVSLRKRRGWGKALITFSEIVYRATVVCCKL